MQGYFAQCNKIWKKNLKLVSVEFDSQPVYDEKYIKTRAKTFEGKVATKFRDNEIHERKYSFFLYYCNLY